MKKIGVVFIVLLLTVAGIIYVFRHEIFQFSAEAVIKKNLPSYVTVERIIFDLKNGIMRVKGLGIRNPEGYQNRYLAHLDSLTCVYKTRGPNILDGIEVTDIETKGGTINIERLANGRLNVNEMDRVMRTEQPRLSERQAEEEEEEEEEGKPMQKGKAGQDTSKWIKLPDTIGIRNGKVIFLDKAVMRRPYVLTFEDINADLSIGLSDDYTAVTAIASHGAGAVNGDGRQKVEWKISLDPRRSGLTMSNRFNVSNVDITLFEPYYDRYSPVIINTGRCSGTLVLDFDNGNIGSMNTLRISDLSFRQKKADTGTQFWDVAVSDIVKYLQSAPDEITFDFKIKGDMENPRFYPGPIVKNAIQNMAVDKLSELLGEPAPEQGEAAVGKSDTEKVVDVIRELLKK